VTKRNAYIVRLSPCITPPRSKAWWGGYFDSLERTGLAMNPFDQIT
jgi:hypothetical protein